MGMNDIYRQTLEYQEGRNACSDGIRRGQNPYSARGNKSAYAWWLGWDDENDYRLQIADDLDDESESQADGTTHYIEQFDDDEN